MTKDEKRTLTPRLRFPEFQEKTEWKSRLLADFIAERTEVADGSVPLCSLTIEDGVTSKTDRYERSFLVTSKEDAYKLVLPNDFALNPMNLRFGAIGRHTGSAPVALSKYYNIFECDGSVDPRFCELYFRSSAMVAFYDLMATGTLIEKRRVHFDRFLKFHIPFPEEAEQHKIADCLTSLDELIAAQGRKVEALKAHKKGLMQQLFPREGETLPRLRFPEFHNAPEWEPTLLERTIDVASGQVNPTEPPYCDLPHIGGENIESDTGNLQGLRSAREDAVISGKYSFDERDILYSKIRPALNKVAAPNFKGICSADIYPIRPSTDELLRAYLVYLLRSESFVEYATKHSARGKIPKINRESLLAYSATLPRPPEQQRIADCLSTLDARIAAEADKHAALKTHKQGMMQQLFPSPEEV